MRSCSPAVDTNLTEWPAGKLAADCHNRVAKHSRFLLLNVSVSTGDLSGDSVIRLLV